MSIRKQYDSDLEALKTALVEMGQNAAEAVENALEALCTADTAAAQKIVQGMTASTTWSGTLSTAAWHCCCASSR